MKDYNIKRTIDEYIESVPAPKVSLEGAKNIISSQGRKQKTVKRFRIAFASFACACLIIIMSVTIVNSNKVRYYDVNALTQNSTSFSALYADDDLSRYVEKLKTKEMLRSYELEYDLFRDGESVRLLRINIRGITRFGAEKATLYVEFSAKNSSADIFKDYYNLEDKDKYNGVKYKYRNEQIAGEWVSDCYFKTDDAKCFIHVESPMENSYMTYLKALI